MDIESKLGSRFIVDLGEIKLSRLVEKQVESEIQAIVLRALATNGGQNNQRLPEKLNPDIWDLFPGQTLGMWIGDRDKPPIISLSRESNNLTASDHTLIVNSIMEYPFEVFRKLPERYKSKGSRPSGRVVLEAAMQVEDIDSHVKNRIRATLDLLPQIEEAQAAAPEAFKNSIDELRKQLTQKTTKEKLDVLRDKSRREKYREVEGLDEGMRMAAQILEDGQTSIYSTDHSFYKLLRKGASDPASKERDTVDTIKDSDAIGAAAGGGVGAFFAGIGIAPGAAAGGAGASAGAAIGSFINWLMD